MLDGNIDCNISYKEEFNKNIYFKNRVVMMRLKKTVMLY